MDPEFQRALVIVLVAGTLVIGAGALALYAIFRRLAGGKSPIALMAGLVGFIFLACLVLFAVSYTRG